MDVFWVKEAWIAHRVRITLVRNEGLHRLHPKGLRVLFDRNGRYLFFTLRVRAFFLNVDLL